MTGVPEANARCHHGLSNYYSCIIDHGGESCSSADSLGMIVYGECGYSGAGTLIEVILN